LDGPSEDGRSHPTLCQYWDNGVRNKFTTYCLCWCRYVFQRGYMSSRNIFQKQIKQHSLVACWWLVSYACYFIL